MTNATSHVRFNRLTGARGTSKTQFSSRTSPFSFWMFFFCNNVTLALLPVLITLQLSTLAMTTTAITTKHTHTHTNTEKKELVLLRFGFCRKALFLCLWTPFLLATIRYVLTTRTHAQAKAQKTSSQREKGGLDARGKEGAVCAPLCS